MIGQVHFLVIYITTVLNKFSNFYFTKYCMVRNIGVELNLAVSKINPFKDRIIFKIAFLQQLELYYKFNLVPSLLALKLYMKIGLAMLYTNI